MKFFLDSCSLSDIKKAVATGFVEGLTTNPVLLSKASDVSPKLFKDILACVPGPVSFQVLSETAEEMAMQGERFAELGDNVVVKIPLTLEGLKAIPMLTKKDIPVNATLCFSAISALLAAKAGARYVSPFMGRLEDAGGKGSQLIEDIRILFDVHGMETEIMAASIRSVDHIEQAALSGAEIATLPTKIFWQLFINPLTEKGLGDVTPHYGTLQKKLLT